MARLLAGAGLPAVFSYAGRTAAPVAQPLPIRVGGFGGVEGLTAFLRREAISHVIDATHPFAAQMSANAIAACAQLDLPLLSMERPAWQAQPGDQWQHVPDMAAAAQALSRSLKRVFLAIGRKQLAAFAGLADEHQFVLRVIDQEGGALPLPASSYELIVARGPFRLADELALLGQYRIDCIVSKNAGGADTYAKIEAARQLGIPVIMVDRPVLEPRTQCQSPQQAMEWLRRQRC